MQGSTGQSGNQNGQKQGGLSWTQSPSSGSVASNINANNAAKPVQPNAAQASANKPANNQPQKTSTVSSGTNRSDRQGSGARTAGIFIAGVIVGLIIGWGWFSLGDRNPGDASDTGTAPSTSDTAAMPSSTDTGSQTAGSPATGESGSQTSTSGTAGAVTGSNTLSVLSQAAGLEVSVTSVSVSVPTWVVVFENLGGKPGNALGAKMFFPGDTSGTVDLLRGTTAGQSYFVGEYVDNGDHQFSKQKDSQVNTAAGTQ
ncbi:MAG TPA: hypothetical protein VN701_02275, partial [Candidatus Paceibacterota bacterium]|nr:hypothetical protein [Candidatus Paceibacterota bacterium]